MTFQKILDSKMLKLKEFYSKFGFTEQEYNDDMIFNAHAEAWCEYNRQSIFDTLIPIPTTSDLESGTCSEENL
jgi:hypothetical protein